MLISAIVDAQDTAPECLAAVLFELLRRHSSQYNEQQIDRNRDLRKMIVRKAESSARQLMPTATDADWRAAQKELGRRL